MKICTKCKNELPATIEYFHRHNRTKNGLRSVCKECRRKRYIERLPEEQIRILELKEKEIKTCSNCKKELPATTEYFYHHTVKNGLSSHCKKCIKDYQQKNKDRKKEYDKEYSQQPALYDTYESQISYAEEVRRNEKDSLEIKCAYCGKWYIPTLYSIKNRIQILNGNIKYRGEARFYCTDQCKEECSIYGQQKYPKGFKPVSSREVDPQLRQLVFERDNWTCQKCEKKQDELETGLHCHHIDPVVLFLMFQNDVDSCITLCKDCHKEVHKLPDCGYHELRCNKID